MIRLVNLNEVMHMFNDLQNIFMRKRISIKHMGENSNGFECNHQIRNQKIESNNCEWKKFQ